MIRHFAFFDLETGQYRREWCGDVPAPPVVAHLRRSAQARVLRRWATAVSGGEPGELGLDVTAFNWPVGDFCYCSVDLTQNPVRLEWGPMRRYLEVRLDTLEIVANQESHRPIRPQPGRIMIDITETWLAPYWGALSGRFVRGPEGWYLETADVALEPMRALGADVLKVTS